MAIICNGHAGHDLRARPHSYGVGLVSGGLGRIGEVMSIDLTKYTRLHTLGLERRTAWARWERVTADPDGFPDERRAAWLAVTHWDEKYHAEILKLVAEGAPLQDLSEVARDAHKEALEREVKGG